MTTRGAAPTHRSISAVALIAVLVVGVATPSAVATTTYRYWSYWIVDAGTSPEWGYASEGAGTRVPADGSVEGWRFGVSSGTMGAGLQPRATADFDRICADTPAEDGLKRVAVIIDPMMYDGRQVLITGEMKSESLTKSFDCTIATRLRPAIAIQVGN